MSLAGAQCITACTLPRVPTPVIKCSRYPTRLDIACASKESGGARNSVWHYHNISTDVQNGVDSHYVRTALTRKVGSHKSVAQHTCATQARHQWQHICSDVCSQGVCTAVRKHMHRHFSPTRAPACTGVAEGNHSRPPVKGQAQHQNVCAGSTKRSRCLGCGRVGHPTPAVRPDPRGGRHRAELLTIRGAIVHSETSENTRRHSRTDVALPAVVHVRELLGQGAEHRS